MSILSKSAVPQNVLPHADRLARTRVLIFGGASGIGFGIDNMALSNGATVVISGSQQAKIDEKVQLPQSLYPSISPDKVSGYAIDFLNSEKLKSELHSMFETITCSGTNKMDHIALTAGDHYSIPKLTEITLKQAMAGSRLWLIAPLFIAKLISTGAYMPL